MPDFSSYEDDLLEDDGQLADRPGLLKTVEAYFAANGIEADWSAVESAVDSALVTTLSMLCPFAASERQTCPRANQLLGIRVIRQAALGQGTYHK